MPKVINVPVNVSLKGDLFTVVFMLEGREVSLSCDGAEWSRSFDALPIEPPLDVYLLCKGLNGTAWELNLMIDGQAAKPIKGEVKKGYSVFNGPVNPDSPKTPV